jgi:hypothetical protein
MSQSTISDIEVGRWAAMPVAALREAFTAVGADFECVVRFHGGALDRLLDERHAATTGAVAALLQRHKWVVAAEVTFNHYGDRGSIDLLAYHARTRTALVVEVKTEIVSAEETLRRLDVKVRLASALVRERFGEWPVRVVRLLAVRESTVNRTRVRRLESLFEPAFPLRGGELRRWLVAPGPAAGAILFVRHVRDTAGGDGMRGARRVRPANGPPGPQPERGPSQGRTAGSLSQRIAPPGAVPRDGSPAEGG